MIVCGMDECGRGPLAGPMVACATVLSTKCSVLRLKDSKKTKPGERNVLYKQILELADVVEIEVISVRQINSRGIGWANKEVFKKLIKKIKADKYIVDGPTSLLGASLGARKDVECMVKADSKIPEVMAASIVAKVVRDQLMMKLHNEHVMYGWQSNKGYGTKYHIQALREYGMTKYHRRVFVRTALNNS